MGMRRPSRRIAQYLGPRISRKPQTPRLVQMQPSLRRERYRRDPRNVEKAMPLRAQNYVHTNRTTYGKAARSVWDVLVAEDIPGSAGAGQSAPTEKQSRRNQHAVGRDCPPDNWPQSRHATEKNDRQYEHDLACEKTPAPSAAISRIISQSQRCCC